LDRFGDYVGLAQDAPYLRKIAIFLRKTHL